MRGPIHRAPVRGRGEFAPTRSQPERQAASRRSALRRNSTSQTPWPSFRPRVLELGQRPPRGARREAVGGVREQRLGRERREDFLRVVLPVGGRVQVAARREARSRARARTTAAAAAACGGASSATDRESRRARRRATRAGIICVDDVDGVVPHRRARWRGRARRLASAARRRPARALRRRESRAADAPARSPRWFRPCRSRSRGPRARGGRTAPRSRASPARTATPKRGSSSSSARACAGDMRPWRSTKLRIGRGARSAARFASAVTAHAHQERCHSRSVSRRSMVCGLSLPAGVNSIVSVSPLLPADGDVRPRRGGLASDASLRRPSRVIAPHGDLVRAAARGRSRRRRRAGGRAPAPARPAAR